MLLKLTLAVGKAFLHQTYRIIRENSHIFDLFKN